MRGQVSGGARADREEADRDLDEGSGLPAEDCRGPAHVAIGKQHDNTRILPCLIPPLRVNVLVTMNFCVLHSLFRSVV